MADVKMINGKYYDFDPQNKSFTQTAYELKTLGIKNYYFMLEIKNPRVLDIDPWNPKITKQEIELLMIEIKSNLWFYMRTVARIRSDLGIVPFGLHRGLAASIWCFLNDKDNCLCEPRQTWKTSGIIAGPITWAFQLSSNLNIHFFGKETKNTKRNLKTLKEDIELLPPWLQFRKYIENGKIRNTRPGTETLENKIMHNTVTINPRANNESHAQGLARGASAAILYLDEIEHTPFFPVKLSNSAPAYKTASDNAKLAKKPYGRILTTTPGNLDTREGLETYPLIKSMIPWTEKIYDMTDEEYAEYKSAYREAYHNNEENKADNREVVDILYIEYQYYQLRKSYDWVIEQFDLTGDKIGIRREILLQRLRGSSNSPISAEDIEYLINKMKKSDNDLIINNKWRFRLYDHDQSILYGRLKDLDESIPYLVGVDPAGGGGGDNIAITIVNPYNFKVAAEFKNPYISGTELTRLLITLISDYIPKGVLCVERNSMGVYLISMLLETSIKSNLYFNASDRQIEQMAEESSEDFEIRSLSEENKKYGTYVTGKVKKAMFEILFNHIDRCKDILLTEYLVDDLCKLVRVRTATGNTTIQAVKGEHDDNIMSYLHAMYVFYTGDNLELFGINSSINPINGVLELENEEDIILSENNNVNNYFNTNDVQLIGSDIELFNDAIRMEEEIKMLVNSNLNVYSDEYKKVEDDPFDDTTSIDSYFFDTINSW